MVRKTSLTAKVDWENTWMIAVNPVPKNRDKTSLRDGRLHIRCD